jgi:hypothetical protein
MLEVLPLMIGKVEGLGWFFAAFGAFVSVEDPAMAVRALMSFARWDACCRSAP